MIGLDVKKIVMIAVLVLFICPLAFAANDLPSAFKEGKVSGTLKVLSFSRDLDSGTDWKTNAIGGILSYKTAPLAGFSAGAGFKTSQGGNWQDDDKKTYSGILPSTKDDYTALSEYYLQYEGFKTKVTLGAQYLKTPWVNGHDIRLTPKAYNGLSIINRSLDNVTFHGYYLNSWMDWTNDFWETMAAGFTNNQGDKGGAYILGADWAPMKDLRLKLWYYMFEDVLSDSYIQAYYKHTITQNLAADLDLRYMNQSGTGDELAGEVDSFTAGGWAGFAAYGAKLSVGYATVGDHDIQYPFGHSRIITMQVNGSHWAKSDVYAGKLAYDFKQVGINGLSAYILYADFQVPDDIAAGKYDDTTETNFSIKYKFGGKLKGLSFWARHAIIDEDEATGGVDYTDTRFYLVYKF